MPVSGAKKKIETALRACSGIEAQLHRFGGTEYRLGRREIGHVHGDHLVPALTQIHHTSTEQNGGRTTLNGRTRVPAIQSGRTDAMHRSDSILVGTYQMSRFDAD